MAAASEPSGRVISGTMLWFNVREKNFAEWKGYMSSYSPRTQPFLTYIVHGLKGATIGDLEGDDYWWNLQSSTLSIYIAEVELTPQQISSYPKLNFPVLEAFIPGLIVSAEQFPTFPGTNRPNALEYAGDQRRFFLSGLLQGVSELHSRFLAAGRKNRQDAKYLGKSRALAEIAVLENRNRSWRNRGVASIFAIVIAILIGILFRK